MSQTIQINPVELATYLASHRIDELYQADEIPYPYEDNEEFKLVPWHHTKYTEQGQITFDKWYDWFYGIVTSHDINKYVMEKLKLKKSRFIEWYFADEDTRIDFGNNAISTLKHFGSFNVDVNELFESCLYIPKWLCEGQSEDDYKELEPCDIQLIN